MISSDCTYLSKERRVKVEESGRSATFSNPDIKTYRIINFDGCVVQKKTAADYIIERDDIGQLILELKGKDVSHAIDQVLATLDFIQHHNLRKGRLSILVVCRQYPKFDTKIQRAQIKVRKYKSQIRIVAKNTEFDFEALFN